MTRIGPPRVSTAVVVVWAVVILSHDTAEACFCPTACVPRGGSSVFEATVTGFEVSTAPDLMGVATVTLSDVRVISGAAPRALVRVGSSCDFAFALGVRYRIEGEPTLHGAVQASQCGATKPVWTWDIRTWPTVAAWWWGRGRHCPA